MIGCVHYHRRISISVEELQSRKRPVGKLLKEILVVDIHLLWKMSTSRIIDAAIKGDYIRLSTNLCIDAIAILQPMSSIENHREDDITVDMSNTIGVSCLWISLGFTDGIAE